MTWRNFLVLAICVSWAIDSAAVTVTRADGRPLDPNGEPLTVEGSMVASKMSLKARCDVTMTGTIKPDAEVRITAVKFSGGGSCALIKGIASEEQPWTGQALSATQLQIDNLHAHVSLLGDCGPTTVVPTWSNADSSLSMSSGTLAPDCTLTGRIFTTPRLHVE